VKGDRGRGVLSKMRVKTPLRRGPQIMQLKESVGVRYRAHAEHGLFEWTSGICR
jgi:hypothetical protein